MGALKTALRHLGVTEQNTMSAPMTALTGDNVGAVAAIVERLGVS